MKKVEVAVLMGSDSDLLIMQECFIVLRKFGILFETHVLSAHRTPEDAAKFARTAKTRGIKVIIAGAGGAAHLAGVIAAHTILPVIGVPLNASSLNGLDALLATVQMPSGIPVATVAVGKAGAANAAILAVQIIGTSNTRIANKLLEYKRSMVKKVRAKNAALSQKLKKNEI